MEVICLDVVVNVLDLVESCLLEGNAGVANTGCSPGNPILVER